MQTTELDVTGMQNFLTNWVGNCKTQDCYDVIALVRESLAIVHEALRSKLEGQVSQVTYNVDLAQRVIQQQITSQLQEVETNLLSSQKQVFNQIQSKIEPLKGRLNDVIKWMVQQGYSFEHLEASQGTTSNQHPPDSESESAPAPGEVPAESTSENLKESEDMSNGNVSGNERPTPDFIVESGAPNQQPVHASTAGHNPPCSTFFWIVDRDVSRVQGSLAVVASDLSPLVSDGIVYGPYISQKGAERVRQQMQICLPLVGRNPSLPKSETQGTQSVPSTLTLPDLSANGMPSSGDGSDTEKKDEEEGLASPSSMVHNLSALSQYLGGPYLSPKQVADMVDNLGTLLVDRDIYIAPIEQDDEDYDLWP